MADLPKDEKAAIHTAESLEKYDSIEGGDDENSVIEGSEGVTAHDLNTLRHVADSFPLAAWLVVIVEFAERYVGFFSTHSFIYPFALIPSFPTQIAANG